MYHFLSKIAKQTDLLSAFLRQQSLLVLCLAGFLTAQPASVATIEMRAADGSVQLLVADTDDDGDGISNALELGGFTYSVLNGLQPWNGDSSVNYYITDPTQWSTDGDPYSDFMEVSGINMPAAVSQPENHPLVAARPVIRIKMSSYDVIPLATITNSQGGEESNSFTNTTSNSNTVSASVTVGASLNPFELTSAEVTASYSHTWTNTQSSTSSFGSNWNNTRSTQPDKAARLKLRLFMENAGGATAIEVSPTINLSLGNKTIATFIPDQKANILTPPGTSDSRFPKTGDIVIEKDNNNNDIVLTLEELKSIQQGTPLSLEVVQVDAKVVRWNANDQDWNSDIDWASFESQIDPVTIDVLAELGEGVNHRYQVFAGTPYWDPNFSMGEILSLIFDIEESVDGTLIEGRKYPDNWYLSTPSEKLITEWEDAGRPADMFPVKMHRNTKMVMISPGKTPAPQIGLATFSSDYQHILVSATPANFPILSATAEVRINGQEVTVPLQRGENSFYTNASPLDNIPEGPGIVKVENARGDIISAAIVLPAIYKNAMEVKEFNSFLPNPGADYWIYQNGDESKPMLLYCLFFDPETGDELVTPREYVSLKNDQGSTYSDYVAYEQYYRFYFDKVRINPSTLKMASQDKTFMRAEVVKGSSIPNWIKDGGELGKAQWAYPDTDSAMAAIDLNGTPFNLDFTVQTNMNTHEFTFIDAERKVLTLKRRNLPDYEPYDYSGVIGDSIPLRYGFDAVPYVDGLPDGQGLHFNAQGNDGWVNMYASPELDLAGELTMEAWIFPTGAGLDNVWGGIIMNKEGMYELLRRPDGSILWAISTDKPGWIWHNSYFKAPLHKWLHIAVVYNKTELQLFFNGVLFQSLPVTGEIRQYYEQYNQFRVGARELNNSTLFQGVIDEVRIWDRARSANQIAQTFSDTLNHAYYSSADSGLVGYWRFDSTAYLGDGVTVVKDLSVSSNDGRLNGDVMITGLPTDILTGKKLKAHQFVLRQNYPNPFNPATTISYTLKKTAEVAIEIYNIAGQKVKTLVQTKQSSGNYAVSWDATNMVGATVASGTYIYLMRVNNRPLKSYRMLFIK